MGGGGGGGGHGGGGDGVGDGGGGKGGGREGARNTREVVPRTLTEVTVTPRLAESCATLPPSTDIAAREEAKDRTTMEAWMIVLPAVT